MLSMRTPHALACAAVATVTTALSAAPTAAQQSFRNTSAAQPSTGVVLVREVLEHSRYEDNRAGSERIVEQTTLETQIAFGISKDVAIIGILPLKYRHTDFDGGGSSNDFHFGDATILLKWRIWQNDTGPVDTMRLSLIAGLDIPIAKAPFDNNGWDPQLGVVFTSIQGRHGVNASARYKFNTHERDGPALTAGSQLADAVFLDGAYLYRIAPAAFEADSHGAWYIMAEVNAVYETNGDFEALIAPGIMYEARNWVLELSVQVPVVQDIDKRGELEYSVGVGFRLLF